jgi:hypothetical protein
MSKKGTADLRRFLKPYPEAVQQLALWLREFVWDLYPDCNELIYDNYNAVAFGWSPTDRLGHTFCSIAVMPRYVHFGFYWGTELKDPKKLLLGKGNQYRYIIVKERNDFPKTYIKQLTKEAYVNSLAKVKDPNQLMKSATITKSISLKKKRPGILITKKPVSQKIKSLS